MQINIRLSRSGLPGNAGHTLQYCWLFQQDKAKTFKLLVLVCVCCGECNEHSPLANVPIKVENSHFNNLTNTIQNSDTWETPLLFLQVFRANPPTYFPSLPLVSLFATCASSSASAPTLCLHHPDPCHLPSSQIPLPIFPTVCWWDLTLIQRRPGNPPSFLDAKKS